MILGTRKSPFAGADGSGQPPQDDSRETRGTRQLPVKIEIHHLNVWYGTTHALHDVNMTVPEATITALVGPSGSGKSTLLRSLNRLHDLSPTTRVSGTILLDGEDITPFERNSMDVSRLRQQVGMVFQKPNPFPQSIFENVAYGLRLQGPTTRRTLQDQVEQALRHVKLWDEVKDQLKGSALKLSCGQQQRLCLARVMATAPQILLLDEPHTALDPSSAHTFEQVLLQLGQRYTIIIATCNPTMAHRLASKICHFMDGHLEHCTLKS